MLTPTNIPTGRLQAANLRRHHRRKAEKPAREAARKNGTGSSSPTPPAPPTSRAPPAGTPPQIQDWSDRWRGGFRQTPEPRFTTPASDISAHSRRADRVLPAPFINKKINGEWKALNRRAMRGNTLRVLPCGRAQSTGCRVQGTGFRAQNAGCRVQGTGLRAQSSGHRVQGTGHRAQGTGHRVQGTEHRAQGAGYRAQSTGYRAQKLWRKKEKPHARREAFLFLLYKFRIPD
jgi:hypothetical protein